jgi:phosphoribosyl-ATP pyrophosphohydrolase
VDRPAASDSAAASAPEAPSAVLDAVERVIQSRRAAPREGSYVSGLLAGGDARIVRKVGEEATEVVVAALAEGPDRLVAEVADLWFHTLVLLGARGLSARHVFAELARRHRPVDGPSPRDGASGTRPED